MKQILTILLLSFFTFAANAQKYSKKSKAQKFTYVITTEKGTIKAHTSQFLLEVSGVMKGKKASFVLQTDDGQKLEGYTSIEWTINDLPANQPISQFGPPTFNQTVDTSSPPIVNITTTVSSTQPDGSRKTESKSVSINTETGTTGSATVTTTTSPNGNVTTTVVE